MWQRSFRQGDVGAVHLSIQRWGFNGAPRVWQDPTASAGEPATVVVGKHTLLSPLHMRDEGCEPPEHKEVDADGD
jgi:hypothetical protein